MTIDDYKRKMFAAWRSATGKDPKYVNYGTERVGQYLPSQWLFLMHKHARIVALRRPTNVPIFYVRSMFHDIEGNVQFGGPVISPTIHGGN